MVVAVRNCTILHTIETGGPGGAETVLLNLASNLDSNRFRSLVLIPEDGWLRKQLQEREIPTFIAKSRVWYDLRVLTVMVRLVKQEKVDLIHSHLPGQNFYSCLAGCLTGRKTIVTYHGALWLSEGEGLRRDIKLWFVRNWATAVVVVSDYLERSLRNARFPTSKIVRIYNGVNTGQFSVTRIGHLRKELGCADGIKLIGMVANLRQSKGYEYLIRAARKVVDSMPQARFVAVGEINQVIAERLSSLLGELCLQDRFFFLGFRQDVPEILGDLDVFVLSSTCEGFSLATIEAMAAGKPLVVTRSGGPQEIVEDGRTGLLVPPADADALAARICELLRNPERAAALGENARAKVVSEFSLARMVSNYERLYERCLNPR